MDRIVSLKFVHWSPNPQCDDIQSWDRKVIHKVFSVGPESNADVLIKKGRDTRDVHTRKKDPVRRQGEAPKPRREASWKKPCQHLLDRKWENHLLLFKAPTLWYFVMAAWTDLYNYQERLWRTLQSNSLETSTQITRQSWELGPTVHSLPWPQKGFFSQTKIRELPGTDKQTSEWGEIITNKT